MSSDNGAKFKILDLVSMMVCNMLGIGAFISTQTVFQYTQSCLLSLLFWFSSGVISVIIGLCYAELGSTYPEAGGEVVYLSKAFSRKLGLLSSVVSMGIFLPSVISTFCIEIDKIFNKNSVYLVTTIVLLLSSLIVLSGRKITMLTERILFTLKILTITLFLSISVYSLIFKSNHRKDIKPVLNTHFCFNIRNINFVGLMYTQWAYDGWNVGNYLAHMVHVPSVTLPVSILLAIPFTTLCYLFINLSFMSVLPFSTFQNEKHFVAEYLRMVGINLNHLILSIIFVVIPLLGTILACIIIYLSIAESLCPFKFNNSVKVVSIFILCFLVQTFNYCGYGNLKIITSAMQISSTLFYTLSCLALFVLRRRSEFYRPFKVSIGVPIFGMSIGIVLMGSIIWNVYFK